MTLLTGTIPKLPYIGLPFRAPFSLDTPSRMTAQMVPLTIDWNNYWQALGNPASVGVSLDLSSQPGVQGPVIDRILCVKIDNANSVASIIVVADDTGDAVAAAPNTIGLYPITTNFFKFTIYATGLSAGFIPKTQITFYNRVIFPYTDPQIQTTFPQWRGSPNIQRDNILTPGFAPPALGDQTVQALCPASTSNSVQVLPANPAGGFYYLTTMQLNLVGVFCATAGQGGVCQVYIERSTGVIYRFDYFVTTSTVIANQNLFNASMMQLRFDASLAINIRNVLTAPAQPVATAQINLILNYSWNPL